MSYGSLAFKYSLVKLKLASLSGRLLLTKPTTRQLFASNWADVSRLYLLFKTLASLNWITMFVEFCDVLCWSSLTLLSIAGIFSSFFNLNYWIVILWLVLLCFSSKGFFVVYPIFMFYRPFSISLRIERLSDYQISFKITRIFDIICLVMKEISSIFVSIPIISNLFESQFESIAAIVCQFCIRRLSYEILPLHLTLSALSSLTREIRVDSEHMRSKECTLFYRASIHSNINCSRTEL